jgi:hypothetical protein
MFEQITSRRALGLAILAFVLCTAAGVFLFQKTKKSAVPATPAVPVPATASAVTAVHKFDWESYFFPQLEKRTQKVDLPSLRTMRFSEADVELRFWFDASPDTIGGFVIRRRSDKWSATELYQERRPWPSAVKLEDLGTPRSGWDALWKQLTAAGILVLPDSDETNCLSGGLDGLGYVFEVVAEQKYRTYRYHNPQFAECEEAKRVISIVDLIIDEFSIRSRDHTPPTKPLPN